MPQKQKRPTTLAQGSGWSPGSFWLSGKTGLTAAKIKQPIAYPQAPPTPPQNFSLHTILT